MRGDFLEEVAFEGNFASAARKARGRCKHWKRGRLGGQVRHCQQTWGPDHRAHAKG